MREIFTGSNAEWLENFAELETQSRSESWQRVLNDSSWEKEADRSAGGTEKSISDRQHRVDNLVDAYRGLGHLYATINPLGSYMPPNLRYAWITQHGLGSALALETYGLEEADLKRTFSAPSSFPTPSATLEEILARMKKVYTGPMASEILHIRNRPMRRWLVDQLEARDFLKPWQDKDRQTWQQNLIRAEEFEQFIQTRFTGQKRFSLEGCEVLIPALNYLFSEAGKRSVKEVVMGMAHRGRLNVLVNAIGKPAVEIFAMFEGQYNPHAYGGSGDVKYHQGQSIDFQLEDGREIHISLVANPSHLEAVDSVVQGKARATQRFRNDRTRKKVLPVLIHGDSSFSGQGVVAETFNMSQLKGYRTGGTVHIVVNNQIGFTTASADARSTFFATDIAKVMPVPVFHANGDNPEAVMRALELALRWRQKFGQDVVVDIVGYRRLGHNEADEPSFTHPIMYDLIRRHDTVTKIYGEILDETDVYPKKNQDMFRDTYIEELKKARDEAKKLKDFHGFKSLRGDWNKVKRAYSFNFPESGVPEKTLKKIAETSLAAPEGFQVHAKLQRMIQNRRKMISTGKGIDWAFAETLAFGSLLLENRSVRLSGEDCGRGTFSQRHAVWWDVSTDKPRQHTPLSELAGEGITFTVYDSPLTEYSILGFEYGYSIVQPEILVVWEAQFGDFANGAQVIIDQFVSAGESKWARFSGMVMLLPHGYEGQGPEHSNAYLERYLSLCAENNMQIMNLTKPAQYFHALRKQLLQNFRKPLVLMAPKSLLRHPAAVSNLEDFTSGKFQAILPDPEPPKTTEVLILCSGHVWYDLEQKRKELRKDKKHRGTRIIRIEQLYPFPEKELKKAIGMVEKTTRLVWVQEEPENRGAWSYISPRLTAITGRAWDYTGRTASASPATGSYQEHEKERNGLILRALTDYPNERSK